MPFPRRYIFGILARSTLQNGHQLAIVVAHSVLRCSAAIFIPKADHQALLACCLKGARLGQRADPGAEAEVGSLAE